MPCIRTACRTGEIFHARFIVQQYGSIKTGIFLRGGMAYIRQGYKQPELRILWQYENLYAVYKVSAQVSKPVGYERKTGIDNSHFLYPLHFFLWQSCSMCKYSS
jgi:hypothetical protein